MCPLPTNGVSGFPNNYILQNLLEKQIDTITEDHSNFVHSNSTEQAPLLVIEPQQELKIGPFTNPVSAVMTLKNPSDRKICFKIKTTIVCLNKTKGPKPYCVKPNSGMIEPRKMVQIEVILQPFEYDPKDKNHHVFEVHSMFASEDNPNTFRCNVEENEIMHFMLKSVFVMPNNNPVTNIPNRVTRGEAVVKNLKKSFVKCLIIILIGTISGLLRALFKYLFSLA